MFPLCRFPVRSILCRRFHTMNLKESIVEGLKTAGFTRATEIQRLCVPKILRRDSHVVVNAETGSGKTLAFLLPIFQANIKKSLIISPTLELGQQIQQVFNSIAATLATATNSPQKQARLFNEDSEETLQAEVVIATPHAMRSLQLQEALPLCDYVVLDEADAIFSGEEARVKMLLNTLLPKRRILLNQKLDRSEPLVGTQFVFVGATLPTRGNKSFLGELKHRLPNTITHLASSQAHTTVPNLTQRFLHLRGEESKLAALRRTVRVLARHGGQIIVFANTVAQVELAAKHLNENGIRAACFHRHVRTEERANIVSEFAQGKLTAIVATDLLSRGLDLPVRWVLQYTFAQDGASYLHRVGRTARAGSSGTVINFISPSDARLLNAIRAEENFNAIFSRNRSLSKRLRKKQAA
eukprot:m.234459 g.234459  ORF g.234459 m.234459 type:complete len:412 (-) comp19622_c0_seq1:23-1258(-)